MPVSADRGRLRRRARVDPRRVAADPRGDRDGLPRRRTRATSSRRPGATVEPGTQRVRFDPEMVLERIKTAPVVVHAARDEPGARPPDRRRLDGVRDGRQPAERRRPRSRAGGSATGPTTRTSSGSARCSTRSTSSPATRSSRSTSITASATSTRPTTPLTLMDKAIHCYTLGPAAEHRLPRDGPDRPRHRRRDARPRAVAVHGHQLAARRSASTRRCSRASSPSPRATRSSCITPFTLAGAMAPVTLAGALAEQNAEALAGMVLTQVVRPGRAGRSTAGSRRTSTCSPARRRSGRPSTCGPR